MARSEGTWEVPRAPEPPRLKASAANLEGRGVRWWEAADATEYGTRALIGKGVAARAAGGAGTGVCAGVATGVCAGVAAALGAGVAAGAGAGAGADWGPAGES